MYCVCPPESMPNVMGIFQKLLTASASQPAMSSQRTASGDICALCIHRGRKSEQMLQKNTRANSGAKTGSKDLSARSDRRNVLERGIGDISSTGSAESHRRPS